MRPFATVSVTVWLQNNLVKKFVILFERTNKRIIKGPHGVNMNYEHLMPSNISLTKKGVILLNLSIDKTLDLKKIVVDVRSKRKDLGALSDTKPFQLIRSFQWNKMVMSKTIFIMIFREAIWSEKQYGNL